ncbi:centrosomin-like isoform X3 [Euwallacea fornicatus]|uniref:centrosomin-like isoform X3 n=1 Tax=Euwallacea fornicatus TaxID=995702 RepID=UPI0033904FA6
MAEENTASNSIDYSLSDVTSPSVLQLTLDEDASVRSASGTMGLWSPSAPLGGRTVKEVEEQLSSLKKENFNLKLRIYFLEEKLGAHFTLDKDNIVKKNIELQTQIASLQREVKERHELFCQAVKAAEIVQEERTKYSQNKEEQIFELQQDLDNLRSQLQERDNQLANSVYDKSEGLRQHIDALQRESESKDEIIDSLNKELLSANDKLHYYAQQVKEYEENLAALHTKNGNLLTKMQEDQKTNEKLKTQLAALNQKYSMSKYELEHDIEETRREKRSLERTNMMVEMRISALEKENRKQKEMLKEKQTKLDVAIVEAKKNQNLVVSTGCAQTQIASNIDDRSISVPDAGTADGAAQKGALHVQISQPGKVKSPSKSKLPPMPDPKNLLNFERLLLEGADTDTVREEFTTLKHDFTILKQRNIKLHAEQMKACEIIKNIIDTRNKDSARIAKLEKENEELQKELENVVTKSPKESTDMPLRPLVSKLNVTAMGTPPCEKLAMTEDKPLHDNMDAGLVEKYQTLVGALEEQIQVLVATLKEKDAQMDYLRSQYDEILNILEEKENKIIDLEFEVLCKTKDSGDVDRSLTEKGDTASEKRSSFYKQELEVKNNEIEKLNTELKTCTCFLQEIVNKELWDKNKQIEKMQMKQNSSFEIVKLRKDLSCKDSQLKLLKQTISELGLEIKLPDEDSSNNIFSPNRNIEHIKILQEQLKLAKEEKKFFETRVLELESAQAALQILKSDYECVSEELEKSEKLRHEVGEVCAALGKRLEELAIFLDSLLKQESVLGFLGLVKNRKLREIISNSIDMSRSFSTSLMANPDQSLAQLSNITTLLNGSVFQELKLAATEDYEEETHFSIIPDSISLSFESRLCKKTNGDQPDGEHLIKALREQVFKLKRELQVRDNELNRLNHCDVQGKESGVERLSDSGAEQEDVAVQPVLTPKKVHLSEAHSESEAWSEPDRAVSRARIGLDRSIPALGTPSSRADHCESTEDDDTLYRGLTPSKRRSALIELSQDVFRLQKEVDEKSEEIIANSVLYRQKLQELDKELQEGKEKLLQAQLDKTTALAKMEQFQKIVDDLTLYKQQCEETMKGKDKEMQDKINRVEVEKQKVLSDCQTYVQQLTEARNQVVVTQDKVKALEESSRLKQIELKKEYEEDLIEKLKNAEDIFLSKLKAVQEKCEAEVRIAQESVSLVKEECSKNCFKKAEAEKIMTEISDLKIIVESYKSTIASYVEKEKDIADAIKNYENIIASLQSQLSDSSIRFMQLEQDSNKVIEEKRILEQEVERNLSEVIEKYNEQVAKLEQRNSNLELKISEMENSNADLHNRLIKAQADKFSIGLNATVPADMGSNKMAYRRQFSEQNAYSSEDPGDELRGFNLAQVERAEGNSSPDLGIESDHGRFSSLETSNINRPLLQTLEITESMNNLLEGQNEEAGNDSNAVQHCCHKSLEIAQENNELKRKLLRMKRALEETATELHLANQRKKQVEKTICKQIHKTSQVLRKAKANLDSGSDSEAFRM